MNSKVLKTLEFTKIKDRVRKYALTNGGKAKGGRKESGEKSC